jgi:hypothetical protein
LNGDKSSNNAASFWIKRAHKINVLDHCIVHFKITQVRPITTLVNVTSNIALDCLVLWSKQILLKIETWLSRSVFHRNFLKWTIKFFFCSF